MNTNCPNGHDSRNTTVYMCDDSIDSIFTAIYLAWADGTSRTDVRVRKPYETLSFLESRVETSADAELADKVASSIRRKLSEDVYGQVCYACLSDCPDKASYVYRFLIKAFRTGRTILNALQDTDVHNIFKLARSVANEAHHYLEFIRFEELANGVLAGRIAPKNNVACLLAEHFSDRLHNENWLILDTRRNFAVLHSACQGHIFADGITEAQLERFSPVSQQEDAFQSLWKCFFDSIAIETRKNTALQRNNMPLHYRRYMNAENQS